MTLKILKRLVLYSTISIILLMAFVFLSNLWVVNSTADQVYTETSELPTNDVALVLGTNPMGSSRRLNRYFTYRMDAAAELYKSGKVKHLIVSGDNHVQSYNEPEEMQKALMAKGVPESAITKDFAGFRTLDSVVRAKKVFQQNKVTILSQKFHNHRAVFIANRYGLDAVAYNAADAYPGVRTKSDYREYLARVKAVLDLYVLRKKPKFLGDKINIEI